MKSSFCAVTADSKPRWPHGKKISVYPRCRLPYLQCFLLQRQLINHQVSRGLNLAPVFRRARLHPCCPSGPRTVRSHPSGTSACAAKWRRPRFPNRSWTGAALRSSYQAPNSTWGKKPRASLFCWFSSLAAPEKQVQQSKVSTWTSRPLNPRPLATPCTSHIRLLRNDPNQSWWPNY